MSPGRGFLNMYITCLTFRSSVIRNMCPSHCSLLALIHFTRSNVFPSAASSLLDLPVTMFVFAPFRAAFTSVGLTKVKNLSKPSQKSSGVYFHIVTTYYIAHIFMYMCSFRFLFNIRITQVSVVTYLSRNSPTLGYDIIYIQ